ncbi:hypothetical protein [Streptomyces xanthochromogenes]|uniref:hypothetical protein n=1 Tax=Streptomyces xanthochromogenes TaxID=67384 RepID=UPI002F3EF815
MPDLWMPGATRLDIGDHAPTDGGPAKAIAHITWDENATAAKPADLVPYENLVAYFGRNDSGKAVAPHLLWDPFTGRVTQFVPADSRSKSVADTAGGTRTNRAGSVVIQVETLFFPYCRTGGKVYPRLVDTPCKGWAELNAWVRSWGVPDTWPMGKPVDFSSNRSESVWESRAGWYAHAQVPENDHQDPGSWPAFIEEDDMALSQDDINKIVSAVWNRQESAGAGSEPSRTGAVLGWMDTVHNKQTDAIAALAAQVTALTVKVDALSARLPK